MVVPGYFLVDLPGLLGIDLFYELGRYAGINTTRLYDGFAKYDRAGGDDRPFSDYGMIEYDRAHSDQRSFADLGAVDGYIVTYGYVVADFDGRFFIKGVQNGAVLDIYAVADADGIDVAPQNGAEPKAASFSYFYIADHGCIVC